jgi:hypothetical protein
VLCGLKRTVGETSLFTSNPVVGVIACLQQLKQAGQGKTPAVILNDDQTYGKLSH